MTLECVQGTTFHRRRGAIENAFRYGVDYVLLDLENCKQTPLLFSHNKRNFNSVMDSDHGGSRGAGEGISWVKRTLAEHQVPSFDGSSILLLAQPRVFGHVFNPVSFWFVMDKHACLRVAIAEVNNTYGERHSYLCHHPDFRPIQKGDSVLCHKIFHVSPFQPVEGAYTFKFDITEEKIGVWINFQAEGEGVFATLTGKRLRSTNARILRTAVLRPLGSLRVLALIYFQALKLKLKGAVFRPLPEAPTEEVSR